jgi:hypothetical protein
MIRIGLVTRDRGEIPNVLIPPFQCLPEVLIWGGGARVPGVVAVRETADCTRTPAIESFFPT